MGFGLGFFKRKDMQLLSDCFDAIFLSVGSQLSVTAGQAFFNKNFSTFGVLKFLSHLLLLHAISR